MKTNQLLDEVKRRHSLESDYALAKLLGWPTSRISIYRAGRRTLDEETALELAELAGLEAGLVLAWMAAERAERADRPEVARAWQRLARRAVGVLVAAVAAQAALPSPDAAAAPASSQGSPDRLCIMSNRRRWLAWLPGFAELPCFAP